jgi:hypothetical protein
MKYTYENKEYNIPNDAIDKMMDALDISLAEACELYLADNGTIENEEQERADKEAKKGARRYEKSANPRKKAEKVRKVDENKAEMLDLIRKSFENHPDIVITGQKTETEMYFEYDNIKYTVKLIRHRPEK